MINLTQFEATIRVKHNTQRQWSKILKIATLVWRMQMWKSWGKILTMTLNQTNATNVTMHLPMQAIWGHIWQSTVEKSQINATYVILHPLWQEIWGNIWQRTVEKSHTNVTSVTMPLLKQAVWEDINKRTAEKSRTNATNVTMPPLV